MASVEASVYLGLAVLAIGAGLVIRWRVMRRTGRLGSTLTDADVRHIVDTGSLSLDHDDPLDLDEAREAEDRFWSESWDDADEM